MMVKSDGSRSSVSLSMPRAMRAISMPSRIAPFSEAIGVDRLVRERQHVEERVEMAHGRVDVGRLNGIAAPDMHGIERLAEPMKLR